MLEPQLSFFSSFQCTLPVGEKDVRMDWDGKHLKVFTECEGGSVNLNGQIFTLSPGEELCI